jgi:uncharacterized protein (TIGR03382 family)
MRNPFMKKWLAATLCTLALGSTAALAEPDSFGLGTGRNGDLTLTTTGTNIINSYAQVTGPLAPGDTSLPVGTCLPAPGCSFGAGDLVMVLQTTGLVPEPASGAAGPLDISNDPVGRWEFARLASVSGSTMGLTAPLVHSYAANVTQVIKVPEYANVSLTVTGARINALAWNGSVGGVIAFLATGTVSNAGQINANAVGFRGGQFVDEPTDALGCSGLDEPAPLGAQKGEGIAVTRYGTTQTGRGNVANGAGGGVCLKSGGGGGGNYGAGGMGGRSDGNVGSSRLVGGMGGAALVYSPLNRLTPGGGGGAGQGTDSSGAPGGRGGGIIFIRANQLTGTGSIQASGGGGGSTVSDGGSGGGAGGSIYLRFVGTAACGSVSANGGVGGAVNTGRVGPGGGGGGGRVLFQAATGGTCNLNLIGAANGNQQDPAATDGTAYGATAGGNGVPTLLTGGFVVLPTPTVGSPDAGRIINNRRPVITGTARPNTTVIIYIDGVEAGRVTSDINGNYSFTPLTDLPEGSRTVQAAVELDAVQSPRSAARTFTVDVTPPDTRYVSTPPSTTNATSATFQFAYDAVGAPEPGSVTFQCKLDTELDFTACPNPRTYTGLGAGPHTLFVRAVDEAGNVDTTPARYDWTVDLTPPDTRITAGPPRYTNATSAAFSFTHEGTEPGVRYECKLSTEPAFTACSSPRTYAGLVDGDYTFQVRAVDAAGNVDPTPASQLWTVDTTPPTVTIVSGPTGTTRDTSATFDFSSNEAAPPPPGVTYLCKLDTEADFTPCSDPKTYTGLGEGTHRLEVIAEDAAGNRSQTPAVRTWTVDITPPDTKIISGPPSSTNATSATFEFAYEGTEAGTVKYQCKLDTEADFTDCTNPKTYTGLGEGAHTLLVRAVDAVGNVDTTPARYDWTVDTTAPDTKIVSGPQSTTGSPNATFQFTHEGAETNPVTYECRLATETAFTSCTSPKTYTGLADGTYTFLVRAVDAAGNPDPTPATQTWTVDTAKPTVTIVSGPPSTTSATSATFDFDSNEATTTTGVTYLCKLDGEADFTVCPDPKTYTGLGEGAHRLEVLAMDAAGNRSETPAVYTWSVDTLAPDTRIVSGPTGPTRSTSATFEFDEVTPTPGVTFECKLDTEADFTPCTSPKTYTSLAQGEHTLLVRAVDTAGNVDSTPASRTWTVDTVAPAAPVVGAPASGATLDTLTPAITGTAEPGSTVTIIIDGQVVGTVKADASGNWSYTPTTPLTVGPHEVKARATDEAGNTSPDSSGRSFTIVQDTVAPETTITSGPSGTTSEHSATFEFTANEPGVTYECSLDGAAFTPCTSPVTYTNLGEGEHTFQVRARDAAGNVDATPETRTWTIRDEAPTEGGDISFRGDGFGCSATGGDASLVLMGLGTFLALARRRRR